VAKILVVDDERSVRSLLAEMVQKMGHEAIKAENGKDAWEKFQSESVDLSIVDINMPEMDGIAYLEEVKKIDHHAVVIMMTGYPSADTIIQTIEDDGYTYVAKPLEIERMMDLVQSGLAFRQMRLNEKS